MKTSRSAPLAGLGNEQAKRAAYVHGGGRAPSRRRRRPNTAPERRFSPKNGELCVAEQEGNRALFRRSRKLFCDNRSYAAANPWTSGLDVMAEDTDIERRRAVVDERVGLISTGDFLRECEAARLIQSFDTVLDRAAAQGRAPSGQRSQRAQAAPGASSARSGT
jgi:hypothetical protein